MEAARFDASAKHRQTERTDLLLENIGSSELLVVALVAFIFFGPKKLPEMGKKFGKGMKEFKDAMRGIQKDIEKSVKI